MNNTRAIPSFRAGVIGTGFVGPVHVEALRRLGVTVAAICDVDALASKAAERLAYSTGYLQDELPHDLCGNCRHANRLAPVRHSRGRPSGGGCMRSHLKNHKARAWTGV